MTHWSVRIVVADDQNQFVAVSEHIWNIADIRPDEITTADRERLRHIVARAKEDVAQVIRDKAIGR